LIKNSQPFGKNFQKTLGGIFWTHTVYISFMVYWALTRSITDCYMRRCGQRCTVTARRNGRNDRVRRATTRKICQILCAFQRA